MFVTLNKIFAASGTVIVWYVAKLRTFFLKISLAKQVSSEECENSVEH